MQSQSPLIEGNLEFLQPFKTENELVSLSSGVQISIQKYLLRFKLWDGAPLQFDFGHKPVLDFEGEACFAELAILRLFQQHKWEGTWIETYGGKHYLNSMPSGWSLKSKHTQIPVDKEAVIDKIQKAGNTKACFDVVIWKGDNVFFCEAKRLKKDRLTDAQIRFIEGALACGIPSSNFFIIEWDVM